jgi:predicted TPR repeat methyltransferase
MTQPKPLRYHNLVRSDLLEFLPPGRDLDVLELGCGSGKTGAHLKELGIARRTTGIELDSAAADAASRVLDEVINADLNGFRFTDDRSFDLILAPDVVEHLVDPWSTLRYLVSTSLRPGGHLVTSTPNIRFWRILYDLAIHGRFDYAASGILDRTHLRFFTYRTIRQLHRDLNLVVEAAEHSTLSGKRAYLDKLTAGRFRDFLSGQHVVRSRKPRA